MKYCKNYRTCKNKKKYCCKGYCCISTVDVPVTIVLSSLNHDGETTMHKRLPNNVILRP